MATGDEIDPLAATTGGETRASDPVIAAPPITLREIDPADYGERRPLTSGGMGLITVARDRRLGRKVALKELRAQSPELRARFEREALLTAGLEHPGIVSVHEAGKWPNGEPFYAMRLVAGRSLDRVLADARTVDQRLALVVHVIAVADALAYAHDQRVIHRDLKPHNIMVGEFGETVVIDWGLGKNLASPDEPGVVEPLPTSGPQTVVGAVLGTPAYMAPEQARGEPADERADVYAIGAILFEVLSGKPPRTGSSADDIVADVASGRSLKIRELLRGVPSDLVAVVERAMATGLGDRYRTARELADDLRRFQTGKLVGAHDYTVRERIARFVRRYRAAVAIAAVAIVVVATVSALAVRRIVRERDAADAQRALAENRRNESNELVSYVLTGLASKLKSLGRIELVEGVARKVAELFDRARERGEPVGLNYAVAHQTIGDALHRKGDVIGARAEYKRALDGLPTERLVVAEFLRAQLHADLGQLALDSDDQKTGLAEMREAKRLADALGIDHPDDRQTQNDRSAFRLAIGGILESTGDTVGAAAELTDAKAILAALSKAHPDDRVQLQLVEIERKLGDLADARGDAKAAADAYGSGVELARGLVKRKPTPENELMLGYALSSLADSQRGEPQLATRIETVEVIERVAAADRSNQQWQHDLATARVELAGAQLHAGKREAALDNYRKSLDIRTRAAAIDPTNAQGQRELASIHRALGAATGDLDELAQAQAIADRLVAATPSNTAFQRELADIHDAFAEVLGARDPKAALEHARTAARLLAKLSDPDAAGNRLEVSDRIATLLAATGDAAGARTELDAAIIAAKGLPTSPDHSALLAKLVAHRAKL